MRERATFDVVRRAARRIEMTPRDYDDLLDHIGDARLVLIGESTHGTHQFYRERARLTRRLIAERGFRAVAAEADWPDAWRIHRYVSGVGDDVEAVDALDDFRRFPTWMWRNADVLDFVGWLREYNEHHEPAGFYGLDLYSLRRSVEAVVRFLDQVDPRGAARARERYSCFDHASADPRHYGYRAALRNVVRCDEQVLAQLAEMRSKRWSEGIDEAFSAEQNARLVVGAERYYRAMFESRDASWNLRDTHMADTLDALADRLREMYGEKGQKIVVWAHNSHVGDARASEFSDRGEIDLGQLARERHRGSVFLIGFTTFTGTVTAARSWGGAPERMAVTKGRPDSWEGLFHEVGVPRFWLDTHDKGVADVLGNERLERAIGVVYMPHTERHSHYFSSRLGARFDAVIHVETTRAVEPLERTAEPGIEVLPDTWPTSF